MQLTAFPNFKAPGGVEKASESHYATSISIDGMAYAVEECHVSRAGAAALRSVTGGSGSNSHATGSLLMVLDGASTVGVVEDESLCTNVQEADLHIKTGAWPGQADPGALHQDGHFACLPLSAGTHSSYEHPCSYCAGVWGEHSS